MDTRRAATGDGPPSAKGAETRRRILSAAREVLATEGIERFTTRRVAARAGISHGMCHYHFEDKGDLIQALVADARRDWIDPLEGIVDGSGSAEERTRRLIEWMAEPATTEVMRVHLTLFIFALRDNVLQERLAGEYKLWREPFVRLFEDLAREKRLDDFDARGLGEAFASAADGLVQQQSFDPRLDTRALLTALLQRIVGAGVDTGATAEPGRSRGNPRAPGGAPSTLD